MYKLFLIFSFIAFNVQAEETCLDYFKVGTSACGSAKQVKEDAIKQPVLPVVQDVTVTGVVQAAPPKLSDEDKLEVKVDKFLENYGKPPREYVRFNLNPTLENALIWAQKFEEMNARTQQVSDAWGQAQDILKQRRDQGLELPEYERQLEVPKDYTKIGNEEQSKWLPLPTEENQPPALGFFGGGDDTDTGIRVGSEGLKNRVTPLSSGSLGGAVEQELADKGPVEISYYFSAQCPYCKKFEPQLQSLIKELGKSHVNVTCVDVTPANRTEKNIYGKVDCKWRSVAGGEMNLLGIQSTPTLIIDKKDGSDLRKVEGLVDIPQLKRFLMEGRV